MLKNVAKYIVIFSLVLVVGFVQLSHNFFLLADYSIDGFNIPEYSMQAYYYFFGYGCSADYETDLGTTQRAIHFDGSLVTGLASDSSPTALLPMVFSFNFNEIKPTQFFTNSSGNTYEYLNYAQNLRFFNSLVSGGSVPSVMMYAGNGGLNNNGSLIRTSFNGLQANYAIQNKYKTVFNLNYVKGYQKPTGYSVGTSLALTGGTSYYIHFYSDTQLTGSNSNMNVYSSNGMTYEFSLVSAVPQVNGLFRYVYTLKNTSSTLSRYTIAWNLHENSIIRPVYVGGTASMPDNIAQMLGLKTETEQSLINIDSKMTTNNSLLDNIKTSNSSIDTKMTTNNNLLTTLINGNTATDNKVNENASSNSSLDSVNNQLHGIETASLSDMSSQLHSIGTTNNLYSNTGFVDGAWFVKGIFTNLINFDSTNSLRLMITFTLLLGVSLTIIGKLRN